MPGHTVLGEAEFNPDCDHPAAFEAEKGNGDLSHFARAALHPLPPGIDDQGWEYPEASYRSTDGNPRHREAPNARDAVRMAIHRASISGKCVVIADTQDNPGTGGTSSTTGMLHALLDGTGHQFPECIALGVLYDPAAAEMAPHAGVGQLLQCAIGESVQTPTGPSEPLFSGSFRVLALSNGVTQFRRPKMTGFRTSLGPTACLEIEGVLAVVSSGRIAAQDCELFRMVGIDAEKMKVIVVKSSHHFRADFEPLVESPSEDNLFALAPGMFPIDPADLP